ncbi:MAG: protein kinase domain-containing protein [Planctomycetota bacterium]
MDAERYQRVRTLYLQACGLAGQERDAFVEAITNPDERSEVRRLVASPSIETSGLLPDLPRGELELPRTIGRYKLTAKLGEGGMGVVYSAEDSQLGRRVAIKTVHAALTDATAQRRLMREARTAAGVNHPHICQVYEVGQHEEELFIAMELLEGEPLAARLERGPLPLGEALQVTIAILSALEELHGRGIVHRDLKPNNVFLTAHGVKLLDFGLARSFRGTAGERLTQTGVFVGTPGFMAPEVFTGEEPGPCADLFAAGALALEMIAGVPAFRAETPADGFYAVLNEQPPTLTGGPAVEAADRVIQRALAKQPDERPESAAAMARELSVAADLVDGTERPGATTFHRMLVVPFRLLQPCEEIDFLPFGLADALSTSLSGIEGLVVKPSHVGAGYAEGELDCARIARETESQLVLTGTLLRGGGRLRVSAQLLEAPGGELVWSDTSEVDLGDLFRLQDELARRIVDSLALKLAPGRKRSLQSDVPASASAYQYYLRANQLAHNFGMLDQARDLYRTCLDEDPDYAPAWAQLGRVQRVMAKYSHGDPDADLADADRAFQKALELNPNLSMAHNLYAYYQIEERGESREAMVRLLEQARRRPTDAQLLSGLVVACRFCGLIDASIEADRRARRLDPGIRTSVQYTYLAAGEYRKAVQHDDEDLGWVHYYALPLMGRAEEAIERCRERERRSHQELERNLLVSDRTAIEGDKEACIEATRRVLESSFHDPEGRLFCVRNLVRVGEVDAGLGELERIVERGFHCDVALRVDPWLDPVRDNRHFRDALARATEGREKARAAYEEAGGKSLLGPGLVARTQAAGY